VGHRDFACPDHKLSNRNARVNHARSWWLGRASMHPSRRTSSPVQRAVNHAFGHRMIGSLRGAWASITLRALLRFGAARSAWNADDIGAGTLVLMKTSDSGGFVIQTVIRFAAAQSMESRSGANAARHGFCHRQGDQRVTVMRDRIAQSKRLEQGLAAKARFRSGLSGVCGNASTLDRGIKSSATVSRCSRRQSTMFRRQLSMRRIQISPSNNRSVPEFIAARQRLSRIFHQGPDKWFLPAPENR